MKADIITIGDEILIGQVVDTNSSYLAMELNSIGITVRKIHSVGDTRDAITDTLNEAIRNTSLVVITGGLGPTSDDITKHTLKEFFGGEWILDPVSFDYITTMCKKRSIPLSERNRFQAMVPSSCQTLRNQAGSAPGMVFRKDKSLVVALPGVPFEMQDITEHELLPLLLRECELPVRLQKTILTCGLPESVAADKLADWEKKLPGNISLAYLPSPGILRLRLSVKGSDRENMRVQLEERVDEVNTLLGKEYVYGYDGDSLQAVVGRLLKEKQHSLSCAESCTGGNIAHLLTLVPGSSDYFRGSITAYSNEIKQELLQVTAKALSEWGAVSQAVVEQMATGIRKVMNTDFAVASSGIAGPAGGTPDKPVGTVWIAVAMPDNKVVSEKFLFHDNRERNITRASVSALNLLRKTLLAY